MSTEPEYSFGPDEMRKLAIETRKAEIEFKWSESDRELRRWCVEQVKDKVEASDIVAWASKLYEWVRNQRKANAA
jgi:hypothetical protein